MLRALHFWFGLVGVVAFLLTGQFMHRFLGDLQGMADGPRLTFRSAHIYLLFASLLNLALGCYLTRAATELARLIQLAGSLAILIGPVLLGWSFFFERYHVDLARPIGKSAIYLALAGAASHALASRIAVRRTTGA